MSKSRQRQVGIELAKQLANLIIFKSADERFKKVAINEVKISRDLAYAKVFVSLWTPDKKQQDATVEALNRAAPWFRKEIGGVMHMRIVPNLQFILDPVPQQSSEIDQLLAKAGI